LLAWLQHRGFHEQRFFGLATISEVGYLSLS
jgi:hypothetical protein